MIRLTPIIIILKKSTTNSKENYQVCTPSTRTQATQPYWRGAVSMQTKLLQEVSVAIYVFVPFVLTSDSFESLHQQLGLQIRCHVQQVMLFDDLYPFKHHNDWLIMSIKEHLGLQLTSEGYIRTLFQLCTYSHLRPAAVNEPSPNQQDHKRLWSFWLFWAWLDWQPVLFTMSSWRSGTSGRDSMGRAMGVRGRIWRDTLSGCPTRSILNSTMPMPTSLGSLWPWTTLEISWVSPCGKGTNIATASLWWLRLNKRCMWNKIICLHYTLTNHHMATSHRLMRSSRVSIWPTGWAVRATIRL